MQHKLAEKIKNDLTGFTLIELIVSISIITMITGLFLADYKSVNQKAVLNAAADQLASDLRLAQSYALGAKKNEKNGNQVPAGGWGIWMRSQPPNDVFYILFADSNSSSGSDRPQRYDASDNQYRKIYFPGGESVNAPITILSMSGFTVNPNNDNSIVFLPPDPVVYFDGIKANAVATITLKDSRTGKMKNIIVNSFGLIDVE